VGGSSINQWVHHVVKHHVAPHLADIEKLHRR